MVEQKNTMVGQRGPTQRAEQGAGGKGWLARGAGTLALGLGGLHGALGAAGNAIARAASSAAPPPRRRAPHRPAKWSTRSMVQGQAVSE